ncbi:MAG: 1-acyl-sn-glycerol-3-phosphate acyltransferase [Myxococcaceae bacterium]|nr:1-acyl-sn-glycerol-3-phosphate acyltransferase [Myxococcaceae bacterium]
MSRSVLGNDPFQKGAASPAAAAPTKPAPSKKQPRAPRISAPVAIASAPRPRAHEQSPELVNHTETDLPTPHGEIPQLVSVKPAGPNAPALSPPSPARVAELPPLPALHTQGALSAPGLKAARALARSVKSAIAGAIAPTGEFLYERYWRVDVQGAAHIPSGGCVLVANHAGALPLDGPVLQRAVRVQRPDLLRAYWLAEDAVLTAPVMGRLMKRLGAVRAEPAAAMALLAAQHPVIVFPEGLQGLSKPISERYQLKRFGRGGYIKLALRAGVPIVPVAVVGAEESMPLLARLPVQPFGVPYVPLTPVPLPARWHIRFGEPVNLSSAPKGASEDVLFVEKTNDEIRSGIEVTLRQLLDSRGSIFS